MSGWILLLTHVACLAIGGFVTTHPEVIKGWFNAAIDRIKNR